MSATMDRYLKPRIWPGCNGNSLTCLWAAEVSMNDERKKDWPCRMIWPVSNQILELMRE